MKVHMMKQADIAKCPHVIFMPSHYRADGTCKCDDPDDTDMPKWGYYWSDYRRRWAGSREDK